MLKLALNSGIQPLFFSLEHVQWDFMHCIQTLNLWGAPLLWN